MPAAFSLWSSSLLEVPCALAMSGTRFLLTGPPILGARSRSSGRPPASARRADAGGRPDDRLRAPRIGGPVSKKRVPDIAKAHGTSSRELLQRLNAAGIEAKAAASSVEESLALKALASDSAAAEASNGQLSASPPRAQAPPASEAPERKRQASASSSDGGEGREAQAREPTAGAPAPAAPPQAPRPQPPQAPTVTERVRPTRDSRTGERTPGELGPGGRRRVVIDPQASRRQQTGPANQPQRRPRRGQRRRGTYDETIAPIDTAVMEATDLIRVNSGSTVKDVAEYLGVAVPEVIKRLMMLGEMATLTQTLSDDAIQVLADEFEKKIEIVHAADDVDLEPGYEDAEEDLIERPPVVT